LLRELRIKMDCDYTIIRRVTMRNLTADEIRAVDGAADWNEIASDLAVVSGVAWTAAEVSALGMNPASWTFSAVSGTVAAITATGAAAAYYYVAHYN
jgi:hypothetical protein